MEIGPGHGELTAAVLEKVKTGHGRLLIIERDPKLAAALRERFKGEDSLRVTEGNALELLPDAVAGIKGEYSVAGNIPYYITGHLLRVLGSLPRKPRRTALMIQEEVAERLGTDYHIGLRPDEMAGIVARAGITARARRADTPVS